MTFQTLTSIPDEARRDGLLAVIIGRVVAVGRAIAAAGVRAVTSVRGVVTGRGWGATFAAVSSLAVGYTLAWAELVALGWGFVAVLATASFWLVGRGVGEVEVELPASRVSVGEHAEARLIAINRGRRRLAATRLEVPVGASLVERMMPPLMPGTTTVEHLVVPTKRRGLVTVGPARTVRGDPIGLLRREFVWRGSVELHVHPRTISIPSTSSGSVRDLEGSATRDLTVSDISFHALREYTPGDDRRYIHWKSTAKTGTFMVRQFEETRRSRLLVMLDAQRDAYADDEEFELAVSAVASLGARAIRDARTIVVAMSGTAGRRGRGRALHELPTISRDRFLDAMSLVDTAASATSLAEATRAAAEMSTGASLAFLFTGTNSTTAELQQAGRRVPSGVQSVIVRCAPGGETERRTASGLTVLQIGYLEDLRAQLARTAASV